MEKRLERYFHCSIVMLTIFPMTFLIMPFSIMFDGVLQRILFGLVGSMFWISLISGYMFLFLVKRMGRKLDGYGDKKESYQNEKWFQRFHFFTNLPTAAADTAFIAALIVLLVLNRIGNTTGYVIYVDVFILIFSLNVHLLFGGNLYKSILQKKKINQEIVG